MKNIALIIAIFMASTATAQTPDWTVTPSSYQFNMTVTGEGLIDCQSSIASDDIVAAFEGTTCRGVVSFGTEVGTKQLAYLIVYSNQSQGEALTFKLYDASENTVIDLLNTLTFEENGSFGNADVPYVLSNNNPPTGLEMNDLSISDVSTTGDTVANFTTIDIDNDSYTYTLINSAANDNSNFTIVDNQLTLANPTDFATQSSYRIEVEATTAIGCAISDTFTIAIQNTNEAPTDISFEQEDNEVDENEPIATTVGNFIVEDVTNPDSHTYTLEAGGADNSSFSIDNNTLLTAETFDYETKEVYEILVRVTDAAGNFFVKELMVQIKDVVELEDLKANNVITPNGDGFNDAFEVPNVELFDNYEFEVYNENGNLVFRRSPSAGYNNLWDGKTTKGNDLPSGVYYYILQEFESENKFTGVVNLLRE